MLCPIAMCTFFKLYFVLLKSPCLAFILSYNIDLLPTVAVKTGKVDKDTWALHAEALNVLLPYKRVHLENKKKIFSVHSIVMICYIFSWDNFL